MKHLFKKRIVDERMELQSLRNAKKCWNFIIIAIGFSSLLEFNFLKWELKYILPQLLILLVACCYNIYLDMRDGNIYTSENANRGKVYLLYIASTLAVSLVAAGGLYLRSSSLTSAVITFIITFILTGSMMYLLDSVVYRIGKKNSEKNEEADIED